MEYTILLGLVAGVVLLSIVNFGRELSDNSRGASERVEDTTAAISSDGTRRPPAAAAPEEPAPPIPGLAWSQQRVELRYDAASYLSYGYASVVSLRNEGDAPTPALRPDFAAVPALLVQDGDIFALVDGREPRSCRGATLAPGESCAMTLLLRAREPGTDEGRLSSSQLPPLPWRAEVADFSMVLASAKLDRLAPEGAGDSAIIHADFTLELSQVGTRASEAVQVQPQAGVAISAGSQPGRCGASPVLQPQDSCTLPLRLTAAEPGHSGPFQGTLGFDGTVQAVRLLEAQQQSGMLATGYRSGDSLTLQATAP